MFSFFKNLEHWNKTSTTRKAQAPWSRAIGTGRPLTEAALWLPKRSEVTELVGAGARQLPS
ncbi:hypothetical protein BKP37_04585 [Anaerobacillus alkalilacustris]|uniref:Uncharacterized protein n=1 Tax=Anaerobacillus alkalilacustris TaxID=393763 RepID=A0A1S2LX97_9BACI|nr:hypothetical protein BKP37_04585 [Anaerobacillus alkalilacustris]